MARRVAVATAAKVANLTDDDRLLIPALAELGVEAAATVWDDRSVEWESFDGILLRSTWDYHLRRDAFLAWVDGVERLRVPMWNAPSILRRNSHKSYLLDLAQQGIPVVPTRVVARGSESTLDEVTGDWDKDDVILKPAVSASSFETHRVNPATAAARLLFDQLVARMDMLVQPFVPEIAGPGELSIVFIDGAYSHTIAKRAKAGEFRVQEEFGGRPTLIHPASPLIEGARRVLTAWPPTLYARIDGVDRDGTFLLMEAELVEPVLYFQMSGAASRLAAAIASRMT